MSSSFWMHAHLPLPSPKHCRYVKLPVCTTTLSLPVNLNGESRMGFVYITPFMLLYTWCQTWLVSVSSFKADVCGIFFLMTQQNEDPVCDIIYNHISVFILNYVCLTQAVAFALFIPWGLPATYLSTWKTMTNYDWCSLTMQESIISKLTLHWHRSKGALLLCQTGRDAELDFIAILKRFGSH